jgi:drug/metabolite transporter (DMT)-like permease
VSGWDQVSQGISKMSGAITAAGIGLSMFGGLLSSLGLEEFGEAVSWVGNAVTVLGGILTIIPPIIGAINAGLLTPPLGIILAILSAVIISLTAIVAIVKKLSLENRMAEAAEATEKAKDAA